jgi:peptide/nickel transport system ATP-binding protein
MAKPLLHIEDLSVRFVTNQTATQALQHVNISVQRGETVAVVGESGSGKSVTSLSILQLLPSPPAEYETGKIWLTSEESKPINLLELPKDQLPNIRGNKVAMIFQEPMTSLNPVMTCGKQVMEAIQLHRKLSASKAKEATISLFTQVQLPNPEALFNRYPHEISGGQKQRVMIAMAMSCEPELLICDEPTTALDVTVQKSILQLIKQLQQQTNMGVIFITHDLALVAEIADKVVVMYKGSIVEQATTKKLFLTPQHAYTKALLACRPALHQKGTRLPVVSDFLKEEGIESGNYEEGSTNDEVRSTRSERLSIKASPLLVVADLKIHYVTKRNFLGKATAYMKAVDGVSFSIQQGETLGLVGESGCGKSTLGRALLRLIAPTSGKIFFNDENLLEIPAQRMRQLRKQMQLIFQDPYSSLNPRMKIGDAIAEPLLVHKMAANKKAAQEEAIHLLEQVGLTAAQYNRYPHEFSGGQRQRIVIARALALKPQFVVCDESVSALDVSVQAQVLNLLNDLKKAFGFTAIFISHDLGVVKYISDRIMVMQKGKIVEIGDAEQVYHHPQSSYTKQLINSIPTVPVGDWH